MKESWRNRRQLQVMQISSALFKKLLGCCCISLENKSNLPSLFFFNFWFVFCHKDGVGGAEIKLFASAIPGCIRQGQRKRGSVIIFHKAIISNFTLSWHQVSFYLFLFQIERYYLKIGFLENFEAILRR